MSLIFSVVRVPWVMCFTGIRNRLASAQLLRGSSVRLTAAGYLLQDRDLGFLTPFKHPVVVNMAMLRDLTATLPDKGVPTTGEVVGEAEAARVAATGLHWMRFATATACTFFLSCLARAVWLSAFFGHLPG